MSGNHGRQRKNAAKKTPTVPHTNAVYPILRPVQQKPMVPDVMNGNRISRGQSVHSKPATQPRIVTTVAEFVSEVIPQTSNQTHVQNEPIQWVRIQKCPLNEQQKKFTFVVIIGLARGYQIWMMLENGSCEEVLSERRAALRVAHLLPLTALDNDEKIVEERPLIAIVENNPLAAENKTCNVNILSLKSGKVVHSLKFNEQILEVASSEKWLLAISSENIYLCECTTLNEVCAIPVPPSADPLMSPVYAISGSFLAYRDNRLNPSIQSCGGRLDEEDHSYSGQMMSAAKSFSKTVTSIGETLVSSFSTPVQDKRGYAVVDPGVVSVINLNEMSSSDEQRSSFDHYIAHFVAHKFGVGHLAFGNGGRMLFTSNETATTFNIFLLHPHPISSRMGSVQHLYKLYRGNTAAKVIETAFTSDNRWLAVATNHGTTHVFGISPYGGPVCMRTHGGKFVNKESRFERTAGLASENQLSFSVHGKQSSSTGFIEHPALANTMTSRAVVNPRITRYPPPLVLWSYAKIKQHLFSAENLTAWASDNSPVPLAAANRQQQMNCGQSFIPDSQHRLSLCFGTVYGDRCATGDSPVLFVMNSDGMLYLYKIEVRRERLNSTGSVSSLNADVGGLSPSSYQHHGNSNDTSGKVLESPIRIQVIALSQWSLTRTRGTTGVNFICPPLHENSPIVRAFFNSPMRKKQNRKHTNNGWLQHVEVTTYCGPHRRLWMGPQFSFGVYKYTGHASAELVSPSAANQSLHVFTTSQKCYPVLIEKNSNIGTLRCDTNIDATSKIVCGSWNSDPVLYNDNSLANLKEQLEDAMRDSRGIDKRQLPQDSILSQNSRSPR
ncbi:hypothetical protein M3Y96_00791800 [Aphelenchoides besseyi]|nr:hypothetical protein M3Y96_00791800 [Aphelenchoides besseyi]